MDKLAISATSKQLQYGMSFENVCKLKTAVNSLVVSRIDYCNCLLSGAPQYQLNKLQAVMNSAGRLICGLNKFDHISRVLCDRLPWLPAEQRIQYKLCLLFKAQCGLAPQYPVDFCQPVCQLSVAKADYDRPRVVTSSLSRLRQISKNFFCRGCTTGMEQAARKHKKSSVAAIV